MELMWNVVRTWKKRKEKTMSKYDLSKTVVHCTEKWMFEEVLKWHERQGNTWVGVEKPMQGLYYFDCFRRGAYVELCNQFIMREYIHYFNKKTTILSFDQFKQQFMNEPKTQNEKTVAISLSTAKEWYKQGGDLKEVALQAYKEEELEEKEVRTWDDYLKHVSTFGFKTEKQHKSIAAYEKLLLLRDVYNESCDVDWEENGVKYSLVGFDNKIYKCFGKTEFPVIYFKTESLCSKFLANNEQLLKDFFMID